MKTSMIALALLAALPNLALSNPGSAADIFAALDRDADGIVTYDEAMTHRNTVYFTFDVDRDRFLSAEERASMTKAAQVPLERDGRRLSFNDVDKDGRVSMGEFLSRSLDWLWLLDRNSDGSVTSADFPTHV